MVENNNKRESWEPPWYHRMDGQGETPLSRAFKAAHPLLVRLLLSQERRTEHVPEDSPESILERAAYWGTRDKIEQLIAKGDWDHPPSAFEEPPLVQAVCEGDKEKLLELLGHGAEINTQDKVGLSVLHWVALNGSTDIAEVLLDNGAEVNPPASCDSWLSPASIALLMGYQELYDMLCARGAELH